LLPHPDAPPGAPFPTPLRLVSRTAFIYPEVPRPNSNTMRSAGSKLRPMTALLLLSAARAAADGPYVSVSGSATWQDNATNATSGDGILESFTLETGVDLSWLHAVDFSTMLTAGAAVAADACTSFSGLDSLAVGPRLELRHRLGLGPLAPALSLALQADGVFFQDSERSNCAAAVAAGYSQRFNDALQLVLDARVGAFDARNDVFSGGYSSLGATLNWDLDETWRLKALLGWRDGDIVADYEAESTPRGFRPTDPDAYTYTGPRQYVATFGTPYIAYRARAQTLSYGAGVSPAIGPNTALVLQYERFDTNAYDRYVNDLVSASIVHHF